MFKNLKQQDTTKSDDSVKLIDNDIKESTTTNTEIRPTSVRNLRRIAKCAGIRYSTTLSREELCMMLETELVKPIRYLFRNIETGEEHGFHSIYEASKRMVVNPGLIHYYLGGLITIGGTTYIVRKV